MLALSSASGTAPFDAALRRYVEFLTADGVLEVDVEIDPRILLAPDEQIEVFRIVQEGLANVRKHAGAQRAEVWIGQRLGRRIVTRQRRRRRLRRRRGGGGTGPEEHAAAREDDRRRLRPPLTARARDRARGRAPRLARLAARRDLVVQARLGEDARADVERARRAASSAPASSGRSRRPSCTPSASDRSRSWGRPRRSCRRSPARERLIRVVLPAGETRSIWIETRSVRRSRQPRLPSSQTPFISPPVGLSRTLLTTLRLPRCAIP